jgi:rhodanese-related sulfurtransferase
MIKKLCITLSVFLILVSVAAAAGYRPITAEDLKAAMDANKQVVVVDARSEEEFREGHIPKSINIPPEKLGMIASLLPKDKKALIVFYCRGVS